MAVMHRIIDSYETRFRQAGPVANFTPIDWRIPLRIYDNLVQQAFTGSIYVMRRDGASRIDLKNLADIDVNNAVAAMRQPAVITSRTGIGGGQGGNHDRDYERNREEEGGRRRGDRDRGRRSARSRTPPRRRGRSRTPTRDRSGDGGRRRRGRSPESREEHSICQNWNEGKCETKCQYRRVHECSVCGRPHRAIDHKFKEGKHAQVKDEGTPRPAQVGPNPHDPRK